ncbi:metallophosphoesterase [Actinopolymorpha alba]|uniref:metallophosphoesterase n=1 Tax=Actinopolymorpha alba TaxID=533267 RepID=UPI00037509B7|nr:metallophosphoesterase [Actinopolymorpha alba]
MLPSLKPVATLRRTLLTLTVAAAAAVLLQATDPAASRADTAKAGSTPADAAPATSGSNERKSFTLVVIPDTQLAVQNKPELFYAQTQWILDNQKARDIRFVIHEGDIVEWPSRQSDWERAKAALRRLDGRVPYSLAVGNHDLDAWACEPAASCNPWASIALDRSADYLNTYFPRSLFASWRSFGGTYPEALVDNSFFTFSAADVDWLVLSIKFNPTDDELAWADQVVAAHPDRQVIINTHEYQNGSTRTPIGDRIWNAVARKHATVRFILSGHYVNAGLRVETGDLGNQVYGIQADYQTYSIPNVNENGYLRIMRIQPQAGTVIVRTYSPYCAQTGECPAYKQDPANEFTLNQIDFPTR